MYNNPYLYQNLSNPGLLSRLFKGAGAGMGAARSGINWGTLLTNTQKSLGIINQAIPIVYQVKPMITNAKTMFRIADAIKDDKRSNRRETKSNDNANIEESNKSYDNKPIFYI